MRGSPGFLYWLVAGAVVGFGLIGIMTIGYPFLIVGMVLCVVGVGRPGIGGSWAFLIGLGGLPALVFLRHITGAALTALNPYCSGDLHSGGAVAPPGAGTVTCSYAPASYYVLFAISVAITLSGVALFLFLRARSRDSALA
jgi:hypothetical protein